MTVKVISTEPAREVVKRVVCRNCGATLEYVPRDVKHGGGGPGEDYWEWIKCPNCRKQVVLKVR